jgi:DNA-binding response OmpR family regulator
MMNAGRVVLKEEVLGAVWGPEYRDATEYLRVWIPLLRRRLGPEAAKSIKTVRGLGYLLDLPGGEAGANRGVRGYQASPEGSERPG